MNGGDDDIFLQDVDAIGAGSVVGVYEAAAEGRRDELQRWKVSVRRTWEKTWKGHTRVRTMAASS